MRGDQREKSEDEGDRRHHHRAESHLRSKNRGLVYIHPGLALFLRKLDNQDAVLGGERYQNDETDLRVKIERQSRHGDPDKGPEYPNGNRKKDRNRDHTTFVESDQEQIGEQ